MDRVRWRRSGMKTIVDPTAWYAKFHKKWILWWPLVGNLDVRTRSVSKVGRRRMDECAFSMSAGPCGSVGAMSTWSCAVRDAAGQPDGERPYWRHGSRMGTRALQTPGEPWRAMRRRKMARREMGRADLMSAGVAG